MLKELYILNGVLSPKFDSLNNKYTIKVGEDITYLDIEYKTDESSVVKIYNNESFKSGYNKVVIKVIDETGKKNNYYLTVNKEESSTVFKEEILSTPIKSNTEVTNIYIAPLLGSIVLLLIVILAYLLFHKKRSINH